MDSLSSSLIFCGLMSVLLQCTPLENSKVAFMILSTRQIDFLISNTRDLFFSSTRLMSVEASRATEPMGLRISWARCAEICPIDARRSRRFSLVMSVAETMRLFSFVLVCTR